MQHVATPRADETPCRDSLGGHPFLPADTPWPVCPDSGERMVLFFQFDVRPEFGLALASGTHFAVFMSPKVNEIDRFEPIPDERFWEKRMKHFKTYVFGPDVALQPHADADPRLIAHRLELAPADELEDPFLAIGGEPRWYQDAEERPGFDFICQLSENFPFAKRPDAPPQPNSFSKKAYCLFLGNSTYLFARPQPTHPEEVWIVLQN